MDPPRKFRLRFQNHPPTRSRTRIRAGIEPSVELLPAKSAQQDGPRRRRRQVGQPLDGTQHGGRVLDLIDQERQAQIRGEEGRISMRTTSGDQFVEIDDLPSGFGTTPREGTLADVSRPEKQPDREQSECLGRASQNLLVGSSEPHVWQYCNSLHFCQDASVASHGTLKESDPSGPRTDDESGAGFVP